MGVKKKNDQTAEGTLVQKKTFWVIRGDTLGQENKFTIIT